MRSRRERNGPVEGLRECKSEERCCFVMIRIVGRIGVGRKVWLKKRLRRSRKVQSRPRVCHGEWSTKAFNHPNSMVESGDSPQMSLTFSTCGQKKAGGLVLISIFSKQQRVQAPSRSSISTCRFPSPDLPTPDYRYEAAPLSRSIDVSVEKRRTLRSTITKSAITRRASLSCNTSSMSRCLAAARYQDHQKQAEACCSLK